MRATGEEVAVKVQRPGIGDSIALDMVLLRRLMAVIDNNIPQASAVGCLRWRMVSSLSPVVLCAATLTMATNLR